jgi:hypothetical protein
MEWNWYPEPGKICMEGIPQPQIGNYPHLSKGKNKNTV